MEQKVQQPQIDLKNTSEVKNDKGGSIFKQGVILRKVSRFVTGTDNDALLPIPVFYDPNTNNPLGHNDAASLYSQYIDNVNEQQRLIKA